MSPWWFLVILLGGPALAWALFTFLFSRKNTEAVMESNLQNKNKYYLRKYPEVDVHNFRSTYMLIGLLISMGFSLFAFSWYDKPAEVAKNLGEVQLLDEIEQLPPPTSQAPPPPPPPPPPPQIEIVSDEEIIEDEPDVLNTEAEEETQVEPQEVAVEEVKEEVKIEIKEPPKEKEVEEPEIFTIVEEMPEYPGGQAALFKFLAENTKYPPMARENGIEGTVYVGFVVLEDGTINNVQVKRGLPGGGAGCDEEAIRVVKTMPKWKPGKQRGKAVRVAYTLPFKFKLE